MSDFAYDCHIIHLLMTSVDVRKAFSYSYHLDRYLGVYA